MKIKDAAGEFAFRALASWPAQKAQWYLSQSYYFSYDEAAAGHPGQVIKWPAEVMDDGAVYIPADEEMR